MSDHQNRPSQPETPQPLAYQPVEVTPRRRYLRHWNPYQKLYATSAATILLAIACIAVGLELLGIWMLVFGGAALIVGPLVLIYREGRVESRTTEAQYDAAWQAFEAKKREMLAIAGQIYAKAPIGIWRWVEYFPTGPYGRFAVKARRWIKLDTLGQGVYGWEIPDERASCETIFEYKPGAQGTILVRLISPPYEPWHTVEFGFEVTRLTGGDVDLSLWFESDNPLPAELATFWPFHDDFMRAAE